MLRQHGSFVKGLVPKFSGHESITSRSQKRLNLLALTLPARDHRHCISESSPFRTGEEASTARAVERRLRLMDISEQIAADAETCTYDRLRDALRNRYRNLIGVRPEQRQQFRSELQQLHNVTVDELVAMFERDYSVKGD